VNMRIAVLTTETLHHAFFVRELKELYGDVTAFCEAPAATDTSFPTQHAFERERDRFESESWFNGVPRHIGDIAESHEWASINDEGATKALRAYAPDIILVFGTAVLKPPVIAVRPDRVWNLHGGDPERYRGLDTHLWAIYHRDFPALVTTLHRLDSGVDTGDIILQRTVPLEPGMPIHALRRANTEVCVQLATSAIEMIEGAGDVVVNRQRGKGRYYSSMPAVLKGLCKDRFEAYTSRLSRDSG
jgi:folate-dependent phosphoribosylglycinamide formyltransferase PurN